MPPPPEITYTRRKIGVVEIFLKVEAEHQAQAYSHIVVAGEVKIYLERVCNCSKPCRHHKRIHDIEEDAHMMNTNTGSPHA